MPEPIARTSVKRAAASVKPGGRLELGFFGGEPLLEAPLIAALMRFARRECDSRDVRLSCHLTTNGTRSDPEAFRLLADPELDLSISCDGLPAIHDRHRKSLGGAGTSKEVEALIERLVRAGRDFNVVMVVRPDTLHALAAGIRHLRDLGVRRLEPSLDVWGSWTGEDRARLRTAVSECADLWREGLPHHSIGWYDEVLARVAGVPVEASARCSFGNGQIAVAPSGRIYPCERLIGEDRPDHPWQLPNHALVGSDFLSLCPAVPSPAERPIMPCGGTFCRCSNVVRTGSSETPDPLLQDLDRFTFEETLRVLGWRTPFIGESHD